MTTLEGKRLGPYELLEAIGSGGMGDVYRARDVRLDRAVAIKVLPPELADETPLLERFQREARAVAALSHPNILALHDFGASNGHHYAVTELLYGRTVRERLREGPMPLREALAAALQVTEGLAVAHERGIIHRDLKPENVFVQDDGRVKLLDFGLARFVPPQRLGPADAQGSPEIGDLPVPKRLGAGEEPTVSLRLGSSALVVGSVGYMSPEQSRGGEVDPRSDVFSFGALLYEMTTGHRAFRGVRDGGRLADVLESEPPPPSMLRPEIPGDLERIVMHCLEKRPDRRFQSVRDLTFDLTTVLAHEDCDRRAEEPRGVPAATLELGTDRRIRLPAEACAAIGALPGESLELHVRAGRLELRRGRRQL